MRREELNQVWATIPGVDTTGAVVERDDDAGVLRGVLADGRQVAVRLNDTNGVAVTIAPAGQPDACDIDLSRFCSDETLAKLNVTRTRPREARKPTR